MKGRSGERPLSPYGLAEPFRGRRCVVGEGWDLLVVGHRLEESNVEVLVGVDRRTTAQRKGNLTRSAISEELARKSVATELAVRLSSAGDDVFGLASRLANEDSAWKSRRFTLDGKPITGFERDYGGIWIAYYVTAALIVYVLAPDAFRPQGADTVNLESLEAGDVEPLLN